jgi:hypothetical protein
MTEKVDILASQFLNHIEVVNFNRMTSNIADLTALSFLVDRGIATPEDIVQRIQSVRSAMPDDYHSPHVGARVDFLVDILRNVYGPKPRGWTPKVIEGGRTQDPTDEPFPPKNL